MKLNVKQFVETEQLEVARGISQQDGRMLPLPRPAFEGQNLGGLIGGLPSASLTMREGSLFAPATSLDLYTIENGIFFVGHQLDGTILTEDGRPVHQTAAFRGLKAAGEAAETVLHLPEPYLLDEAFVGFDGAWRNYFHWMCFGLTKSFLAARHLDPAVVIAVPDYAEARRTAAISYSQATWEQSLEFSGLATRVTPLPAGVYRVRKLHFFWTTPRKPTDILYLDAFKSVFDVMAEHALPPAKEFESIYLARARNVSSRLAPGPGEILSRVLERRGFRTVSFEGADLQQQVSIFTHARRVVSPHGAGLSNTLFHRGGLRMLEINKPLDGGDTFRPWFFVTAAIRNHPYVTLDSAMQDFSEAHVECAIAALDG